MHHPEHVLVYPDHVLGEGAFGRVCGTSDPGLVAKCFTHPEFGQVQRRRELTAAKQLAGKGVTPSCCESTFAGIQYLLMERMDIDLFEDISRNAKRHLVYADWRLLDYTRQIVDAVAQIHRLGIYHMDVRAENIMIRGHARNQLVLIDFGLAHAWNWECGSHHHEFEHIEAFQGCSCSDPERTVFKAWLETGDLWKFDVWQTGVLVFLMSYGFRLYDDWTCPRYRAVRRLLDDPTDWSGFGVRERVAAPYLVALLRLAPCERVAAALPVPDCVPGNGLQDRRDFLLAFKRTCPESSVS